MKFGILTHLSLETRPVDTSQQPLALILAFVEQTFPFLVLYERGMFLLYYIINIVNV